MKLALALLTAAGLHAAPSVSAAVNAASNLPSAAPNGVIARGAMFVVYGAGMGPGALARAESLPLRTSLVGTSVRVTVSGSSVDCLMIYSSANQISAILPSRIPAGDGTLTVTYNGESGPPAPVRVAPWGFGMFTRNQGGSGPAIVQNVDESGGLTLNSLLDPARPEQAVVLWGSGLGPVDGDEAAGALPGDLGGDTQVYVGGQPVVSLYRGRSGCCPGVDQISFRVPQGVTGCYVPVTVVSGGIASNTGTITVGVGESCADPYGPSAADLESLRGVNQLTYGLVDVTRTVIDQSAADTIDASFFRTAGAQLAAHDGVRSISRGACVSTWNAPGSPGPDPRVSVGLNAGNELMFAGTRRVPLVSPGAYGGGDRLVLEPGEVSVDNGSGGPDIGPFRMSVPAASVLAWNRDSFGDIPRGRDLVVSWTGGIPGRDNAVIYGVAPASAGTGGFYCVADVAAGRFTVPGWITGSLPAASGGALGVGVTLANGVRFQANGLRFGVAASSTVSVKTVNWR